MAIQSLKFPDKNLSCLIFPDIKRNRVRFIFSFNDDLKVLAWMMIGSDGSLYLNARLPESKTIHKMSTVADGVGGFLTQADHREIDLDKIASPKVSHHSSGVVKSYGEFDSSTELVNIAHSTLIRQDQYTKPHRFKTIQPPELRSTDILVPSIVNTLFELDAELVLRCSVFVGPLREGHAELHYLDKHKDKFQSSLVFPATNLIGYEDKKPIQDMFYQITFFNDRLGDHPDWTYSSFVKAS